VGQEVATRRGLGVDQEAQHALGLELDPSRTSDRVIAPMLGAELANGDDPRHDHDRDRNRRNRQRPRPRRHVALSSSRRRSRLYLSVAAFALQTGPDGWTKGDDHRNFGHSDRTARDSDATLDHHRPAGACSCQRLT
jgi:hypothetical protein